MATFDYTTCHNVRPYKWTIIVDGENQYLKKKKKFIQMPP
jgi:hypothetical protein